jgi:hypothetical protein
MDDPSGRRATPTPSIVDELLARTRHFLAGMIADYVKRSCDDILRWMMGRVARYAISTALFIMASAFLLMGGAEGLIAAGLPRYLAHLAIGSASVLAGLLTLKCCEPPRGRP